MWRAQVLPKAKVTSDHPDSSYGQPVIVLESDNMALDITSWVLLNYQIVEATPEEFELLKRVLVVDQVLPPPLLGAKVVLLPATQKPRGSCKPIVCFGCALEAYDLIKNRE